MRFAPATAQNRIASRQIPVGSTEERDDDADAVVYHYLGKDGTPYAIGYAGTAYNPAFHLRFQSDAGRSAYVAKWLQAHRESIQQRKARRTEKKTAHHELKLDDIVYSSWGYDQTNVNFYQVVRVVSAKTVEVRRLQQDTTETGFMCGRTTARKNQFWDDAPTLSKRAKGVRILSITSSGGSASKWEGQPVSCSWYS